MLSEYITEINDYLRDASFTAADGEPLSQMRGMETLLEHTRQVSNRDGMLFFAGNGASATMSEHMSHDFFQNGAIRTATCSETAHLTAISNDLSFEDVFAYRINRIMGERDLLVAVSSSGNSPNIVKAIHAARERGSKIVTFTGLAPDNRARHLGDLNVYVPAKTYGTVESAHAVLLHCWLDLYMDTYLGGRH